MTGDGTAAILTVDNVTKSFGGLRAVDGCTLSVAEGSITGLIGPNGAGKTTLFNLVTGFLKPDSGPHTFVTIECRWDADLRAPCSGSCSELRWPYGSRGQGQ